MANESRVIEVGTLLLDTQNPRHEPVDSQRETIQALIATERQKLVVLANDIGEFGLSPIDKLLVIKSGRNFVVVEGNRRLAAIRLLGNPDLAEGTTIGTAISRIAAKWDPPSEAECAVAPSRDEAAHWMRIRHDGEASGAGTVRWNSFATNRFSHKPGTQAAKAIAFLEAVTSGYPDNDVIQELCDRIAQKRLTTLGRLVQDPNFKTRIGMVEKQHAVLFQYPAEALQEFLEQVLGDIAADVGVSQLKSKAQRTEYLESTPKPQKAKELDEPKPLTDSSPPSQPTRMRPRPRPTRPAKPFKDLDLSAFGAKTQAILKEFRLIDVDRSPNAAAVLTRVILELAVDEFVSLKGLRYDNQLRKRIRSCLHTIDPAGTANEFHAIRAGLNDGNSLFAVATLHAFVHNTHYQADGTTVRSIAANMQPFLQKLNDVA